jgi:hypothetical protein
MLSSHTIAKRWRLPALLASLSLLAGLALQPVIAAKPVAPTFVDYAQCANGAPPSTDLDCEDGWINGILQASNSHYSEDQVTPQRAEVNVPAGASTDPEAHSMTFTYQTRKGSAQTHAYDSLATWNWTQTDADRCDGLATNDCVAGDASTFPIPDDTTVLEPHAAPSGNVTAPHMLPASSQAQCDAYLTTIPSRCFEMYGGIIDDVSGYTHSCTLTSDCDDPSVDDYATITIYYHTESVPQKVQLLFGGHLAVGAPGGPRTWGDGFGASDISGGPYHIKWEAADGASIGNRDNQIMGSAIQFNDTGLSTTPSAGGTIPVTLQDSADLSGATATAGGTITFRLYPPSDPTCAGTASYTEVVAVNGPGTYSTITGYLANIVGVWNWTADYTGDTNNGASSSACGSESVTITKASPSFTTSALPTAGIVIGTATPISDTATMSGGYNPTGDVTFALYEEDTCITAVSGVGGTVALSGGSATYSTTWTPLAVGDYFWQVQYLGDANNNGTDAICNGPTDEQLDVVKASPGGTTQPSAQIRDTFTITGGYDPSGTVDFSLWKSSDCLTEQVGSTDTGNSLTGGSATSDWFDVVSGQTYYWKAVYSGDTNNNGKTVCGEASSVSLSTTLN